MLTAQAKLGDVHRATEMLKEHKEASRAFQILRKGCFKVAHVTPLGIEFDGVIITPHYDARTKKLRAIQLTRVHDHPTPIDENGCRWVQSDVYFFEINQTA